MSTAEQKAQQTTTETTAEPSLLDDIVQATRPRTTKEADDAKRYFEQFLSQAVKPGQVVSKDVEANIKYWIKEIDKKLTAQVNEIMHNPQFQKLESTWRGLHYLVSNTECSVSLQIKVFNVTKRELLKDLTNPNKEFDQTETFRKVYEEEYGTLGGQPYGMLMGDYEFDNSSEDMSLLSRMANVAAAAHAPFVAGAAAKMFNFDRFTELPNPTDMAKIFTTPDYAEWRAFRDAPDSRYVALAMPRVLGRLPYGEKFTRVDAFNFEESVDGSNHDRYLWMNAAWAYAARINDAVAKYGWMARTRGVEGGGKVEGLPVHTFLTDDGGVAMKCPTEIAIPDRREFELSNLGFMPLLHCKNTNYAAFLGAQSCQKAKKYNTPEANANAELSTKFNYLLCVSRFAHYLKVMARDKIGSFMERGECERWLNTWIQTYIHPNPEMAGDEGKARMPLAAAQIQVQAVPGKPGWYEAVAHLRPHFQLETLTTSMRLVAEIPKKKG